MNGKHRSAGHAYRVYRRCGELYFRSDGDRGARLENAPPKLSHALVAGGIGNALKRAGLPRSRTHGEAARRCADQEVPAKSR